MKNWLVYQLRKLFRPKSVRCGSVVLYLGHLAGTPYARSIYRGSHETEERLVISRHLAAGDRVLEFGAGLGLITTLCCQTVGADNVVTFEANHAMAPLLKRTFELNGIRPDLRMQMVAMDSGKGRFFVSDRFVVSSSFAGGKSAREVEVPSVSFQDVLNEVRPTFLIMDIEGSEVSLADESIDLTGVRKICVEVHPGITGDDRTSALVRSLLNRGFQLELSSSRGDVLFFQRPAAAIAFSAAA
ncbi:MAG: FkbM family methyltransferase [Planctomycetaceae bacterium]